MIETHYAWKVKYLTPDGVRLLTPTANGHDEENSVMDLLFNTPEEAHEKKDFYGWAKDNWVLVKVTLEEVQ